MSLEIVHKAVDAHAKLDVGITIRGKWVTLYQAFGARVHRINGTEIYECKRCASTHCEHVCAVVAFEAGL